jgi:ArsR family metal-binding transcriptional regulator
VTRAVIKLKQDLTDALPVIARAVENSAYNNITHVVSFRYHDLGVIVYQKEIIVLGADNENKAIEVIDFLKSIIGNNHHKEQ